MTAVRTRRVSMSTNLAIAAGGAAGAYVRLLVARGFGSPGTGWPWATFCVNIVGTFLLGYFVTRLLERLPPSTYKRPLLATGFCGALTTFSTLQLELLDMLRHHQPGLAVAYAAASLLAGFAAFMCAVWMVRRARVRG
jgi:fluoride exporter